MIDYEVVVLGLGGMGSASLARLALRGKRALGIEAFARGHEFGASSGRSRIIRKAYFEDAAYVPLLVRAYALWRELERDSGSRLLDLTGVLMAGSDSSASLAGAASSALLHGIPFEFLDGAELARRYPALRLRAGEVGLFEPEAGVVFPERAIAAQLGAAEAAGAETLFERRVLGYRSEAGAVVVELDDGREIRTPRLALCVGPWLPALSGELRLPVRLQRNVQVWFQPLTSDYAAGRFPAFFLDRAGLPAPLYGFPDYGDGVKAALHGYGAQTSAAELERGILAADVEAVASALDDWMPGAAGAYAFGKACLYALTPDEHFIIDRHPADARIVIAGGFSGHGFKFAPVVGEIVADLVSTGATHHPIDFLSIGRFGAAGSRQGVR